MKRFLLILMPFFAYCSEPIGIKNVGNTCFMNATIQCLYNIEPFTKFLLENQSLYTVKEPDKKYNTVAYEFINFLKRLKERKSNIAPIEFCQPMWEAMIFTQYAQQDAGEFLTKLLSRLTAEDFNKSKITDWYGYPHNKIPKTYLLNILNNINIQILSSIDKTEKSSKSEFKNQLNIPIEGTEITSCLKSYFSQETVTLRKKEFNKQYFIYSSPEYLILILNRFTPYGTKISTPVKLNKNLDLKSYFIPNQKINGSTEYDLVSFVLHSGDTPASGHYTACINHKGTWYLLDDPRTSKIDINDFINTGEHSTLILGTPYIIFYKKKSSGPTVIDLKITKIDEKELKANLEKNGYSNEQLNDFLDAKRINIESLLKGINEGLFTVDELMSQINDLETEEKLLSSITKETLNEFLKVKNITSVEDLLKQINRGDQSKSALKLLQDINELLALQNELNLLESLAKK